MEISHNPELSRYEAHEDGDLVGFLEYRTVGGSIVLVHTEALVEGRGVGSGLAGFALTDLDGRNVVVTCPFVKKYVEKHPEHRVTVR